MLAVEVEGQSQVKEKVKSEENVECKKEKESKLFPTKIPLFKIILVWYNSYFFPCIPYSHYYIMHILFFY